jgi:hypothetical protein
VKIKSTVLIASAALSGASLMPAHAMPPSDLAAVSRDATADVQNVGYVCGPYGCWWQSSAWHSPAYVLPYCGYGPGWYACGRGLYAGYRPYGFRGYGPHYRYRGWWY